MLYREPTFIHVMYLAQTNQLTSVIFLSLLQTASSTSDLTTGTPRLQTVSGMPDPLDINAKLLNVSTDRIVLLTDVGHAMLLFE